MAVLVHFYDTATDIGVLILWYSLLQDELSGTYDYKDVDMKVYFGAACTFMLIYRFVMFFYCIYRNTTDDRNIDLCTKVYQPILAILDLFILVGVYNSLENAQDILSGNDTVPKHDESDEIKIDALQQAVQFSEAVLESLPQVVLQAAFIIRSANDPVLRSNSNQWLLFVSLIASICSVANKYRWMDDIQLKDKHSGFKPKKTFPGCISYWYLMLVIWRYCTTITRFAVFALMWGVCGGLWVVIYALFSFIWIYVTVTYISTADGNIGCFDAIFSLAFAICFLPGVIDLKAFKRIFLARCIDNMVGYILIAIFISIKFECEICNDPILRHFGQNEMIDKIFMVGVCTLIVDAVLFVVITKKNLFQRA
eukprot:8405_1